MPKKDRRVVITGMGILCALGHTFDQVLLRMTEGISGIGPVTRFPTSRFHSGIGAELDEYRPEQYFTEEEQRRYDRCAQYAIIAAQAALHDSGVIIPDLHRAGAALGTCNGGIVSLEEQWTINELDIERTARYPFYQQGDHLASHLGLGGPVVTLNTACAASGNAIGYGYDMIRWGYADVMIAGGSDPMSHSVYAGFNVLRALNPQPSSPFASRYGLSLGEGAAFVVLEPLDTALERGALIYGEICGYGLSNDGYHETTPEPDGRGIEVAVKMALAQSGVSRERIEYINAHGTGTQANDKAEAAGLTSVFDQLIADIPVSSSKAYFGHTLGAAAAVELTTSLYAIHHGLLPATLHYDEPRDGCEHMRIIANEMSEGRPAFMLNNNSAFGGHNVSIVAAVGHRAQHEIETISRNSGSRRVVITGIGTVLGSPDTGICDFSLKDHSPPLYERRMNKLCQFSIGAAKAALEDAGWPIDEASGSEIGFVYGTSRGSTGSIGKFLGSVFVNGPEYASSIYFPHTVINSVAGKTAEKVRLTGFSSSLSSGGTEGIAAALYGYEMIRDGVHERFLVGAGDERSELSDKIDTAIGLDSSRYRSLEGSVYLAMCELETARRDNARIYAELAGFALGFAVSQAAAIKNGQLERTIREAIDRAGLDTAQLDAVILDAACDNDWIASAERIIRQIGCSEDVLITHSVMQGTYGQSIQSAMMIATAAEWIAADNRYRYIATISCSLNGNIAASVISQI